MKPLTVFAIVACGLATACSIRDDRTVVTPQPAQAVAPPVVYAAPTPPSAAASARYGRPKQG